MGLFRLGSAGGLGSALLINIIAISTAGWIYTANPKTQFGLFNIRIGDFKGPVEKSNAEKVAIAFNVMAEVMIVCAIAATVYVERGGGQEKIAKIGGIIAIVAALSILIGMASYTGLYAESVSGSRNASFGYSFYLGWISLLFTFIGAGALFGSK